MEELLTQEQETQNAPPVDPATLAVLEEMMKAGLFLGRKSSKTHPRMKPFIFGVRNRASIIDLEETLRLVDAAMNFVKEKVSQGGTVLLVGTTPASKQAIEDTAHALKLPFVTERWLGGTLTNFKTLSKRVAYFKKLKSDKESGRLEKYTKKERLDLDRKIKKMSEMFSGVEDMNDLPNVVFVADVNSHMIAVREAKRLKIPVVGILNTDTNPDLIEYPIPANDRSRQSISWVLARLEKAVAEGKAQAKAKPVKKEENKTEKK